MSADDEPEVPADDRADADDVSSIRQPPGPDDRRIAHLPPPDDEAGPADDEDAAVEERRVEAELGRLGSWLEPDEDEEAADARQTEASDVLGSLELAPTAEAPEPPESPHHPEVLAEGARDHANAAPPSAASVVPSTEVDDAAETRVDEDAEPEEPTPVAPLGPAEPAGPVVVDEGERPPAPVAPAQRRARRRRRLLLALLVVSAASTAIAVAKTREANDLAAQRDDWRAIEVVAARFGSAYLSYDFAHVEESGRAVTALGTARFGRSYAAERAPGIQQLFSSRQTTTRATTTEVFVGSVESTTARALVVVDVTATSPTDGQQRLDDVTFVLDLARTSVGWRVDQVDRAPQASLTEGTPAPAP